MRTPRNRRDCTRRAIQRTRVIASQTPNVMTRKFAAIPHHDHDVSVALIQGCSADVSSAKGTIAPAVKRTFCESQPLKKSGAFSSATRSTIHLHPAPRFGGG